MKNAVLWIIVQTFDRKFKGHKKYLYFFLQYFIHPRIQYVIANNRNEFDNLVVFQQGCAPSHFFSPVREWLDQTYETMSTTQTKVNVAVKTFEKIVHKKSTHNTKWLAKINPWFKKYVIGTRQMSNNISAMSTHIKIKL